MAKIVDFKKLYSQKRLVYAVLLSCEHIVAVPPSPHLSLTTGEEVACPFCPPEGVHCPPKPDHECVHCGYKKPLLKQLKDGRWSVVCNCGMNTGPCKTPERALSRWNTRVVR